MDLDDSNDLLLEGDDDLLDYFLGENQGSMGDFGVQTSNTSSASVYMDEVNDGMASLLSKPESMKEEESVVSRVLNDDAMFGDNFGLLEPVTASPPVVNPWKNPSSLTPKSVEAKSGRRGRGRGNAPRSSGGRGVNHARTKAKNSQSGSSNIKSERASAMAVKLGHHDNKKEDGKAEIDETEEKRLRRLARNRESARQSRRRKKEHLELLEDRVSKLTAELDQLRRAHIEKVEKLMGQNKKQYLDNLQKMLQQGKPKDEMRTALQTYLRLYGPNSEDQRKLVDYHYKHIFALLLPTYTKYFIWMLNEGEKFFEEPNLKAGAHVKPSVWQSFCNEIHLSHDQQEKLKSDFKQQHTSGATEERLKLTTCINYLEQLKKRFELRSKVVETHTKALFDILTPEQTLRYLLWVEKNKERLESTGMNDLILLGEQKPASNLDPRLEAARTVLEKPEEEMKIEDLKVLMAALDG